MNNKGKNILLLIVGIFLFNVFTISVNAYSLNKPNYDKKNWEKNLIAGKIDSLVQNDGHYISYFGGVYISSDSEHVILQIVRNNIPNKDTEEYKNYEKIIGLDPSILVFYVDYSYEDLKTNYENMNEYFLTQNESKNKNALRENLSVYYIDTINNKLVLEANDVNDSVLEEYINENLNKNLITIIPSNGGIKPYTTLKAGAGIKTMNINNNCSVGFRAKVNGNNGYVTAGHCVNGLNDSLDTGTVKKYKLSGNVDAAWVKTNSSYTPSNSIKYNDGNVVQLNGLTSSPYLGIGTTIGKSGVYSGYTSGSVTYTSMTSMYGPNTLTNLVGTNAASGGGDSGGTVYIPTNVSGGGTLAGIIFGGSSGTNYTMVFVKESYIQSDFGYTRY